MTPVRERLTEGVTRERLALEGRRARGPLGILLAFAIVSIVCGALVLKNLGVQWPWQGTLELKVEVEDASGVVEGQEVAIAGVPAGLIKGMERSDGRAMLTISIDRSHAPIHADARARLRPRTPLQDMYLNIESRGTERAGELDDGDVLTISQTHTAEQLTDVLDLFEPGTRRRLEATIDELGRGLGDDGVRLREAFVELVPFIRSAVKISRLTANRRQLTRRLVHNTRLVLDELGKRDGQLDRLVISAGLTLGELGRNDSALAAMIDGIPPTLERLRQAFSTLRSSLGEVDPALAALRGPAGELEQGLDAVEDFAARARPALEHLEPPLRRLRPTLSAARPLSNSLAAAFAELLPQVPRLDRITARVPPCELEVQKFFHNTASVFKFGDANGPYPRGEATVGLDTAGLSDPNLSLLPSCTDRGAQTDGR